MLVEIPEKRITFKKSANGTKYVYYTTRSYRNSKGKPTSDEKSIGKIDKVTGKLIPNKNYFEIFKSAIKETDKTVVSVGLVKTYKQIAKEIGLTKILKNNFPEDWENILNIAGYMLEEGNIMMDFKDWARRTEIDLEKQLSSQRISELFGRIEEKKRLQFLKSWLKKAKENEYIAYDVTSISSYSNQINEVSYGYNRDKESLPQINLGVYYGEESRTPLYYSMYDGSIVDKTYLPYIIELTKEIKIKSCRFVVDQGFCTQSNIKLLNSHKIRVLTLLPKNYKLYKETLKLMDSKDFSSKDYIIELSTYCKEIKADFEGTKVKLFVYYDKEKAALEERMLYEYIKLKEKNLELLSKRNKLSKSQKQYFTVKEEGEHTISFEIDYDQIDKARKNLGYFILLATDMELDGKTALETYRMKDLIEKNFDQFKNGLSFQRLYTKNSQTTEGKLFTGFISLILRNEIRKRLKFNKNTENIRTAKAIKELNLIRILKEGNNTTLLTLTKTQKTLIDALKINI